MNFSFENVGVDGGNITVILLSSIPHAKDIDLKEFETIPIKKGKYKLSFRIPDCWNGDLRLEGYINAKKDDVLVVADCCYWLEDYNDGDYDYDWFETKYSSGADMHGEGLYCGTGGDGCFNVEISLEKVNRAPHNKFKKLLKEVEFFRKEYDKLYNEKIEVNLMIDHHEKIKKYCKDSYVKIKSKYPAYVYYLSNIFEEIHMKNMDYHMLCFKTMIAMNKKGKNSGKL